MTRLPALIIVLALCGCSATRKASSSAREVLSDRTAADVTEAAAGHSLRTGGSLEERLAELWNRRVASGVIYDTSLPVDPKTGKPPVLAEFRIEDTTVGKEVSVKKDTASEAASDTSVRIDRSRYDVRDERQTQSSEKTTKRTRWWVYLLLAGGVIFVIYGKRIVK